eukprot:ANDGO_00301.mRNA.1 hypothetical protein
MQGDSNELAGYIAQWNGIRALEARLFLQRRNAVEPLTDEFDDDASAQGSDLRRFIRKRMELMCAVRCAQTNLNLVTDAIPSLQLHVAASSDTLLASVEAEFVRIRQLQHELGNVEAQIEKLCGPSFDGRGQAMLLEVQIVRDRLSMR